MKLLINLFSRNLIIESKLTGSVTTYDKLHLIASSSFKVKVYSESNKPCTDDTAFHDIIYMQGN